MIRQIKKPRERWRPEGTPIHRQIRRASQKKDGALKGRRYISQPIASLRRAEGEEILGAFDGLLEPLEEELEVVIALDEVDVGGVDDEKIGSGVAEEEMFVGAGELLNVFGGDVGFVAGGFFGEAGAEGFGLGLGVDEQAGSRKGPGGAVRVAVSQR